MLQSVSSSSKQTSNLQRAFARLLTPSLPTETSLQSTRCSTMLVSSRMILYARRMDLRVNLQSIISRTFFSPTCSCHDYSPRLAQESSTFRALGTSTASQPSRSLTLTTSTHRSTTLRRRMLNPKERRSSSLWRSTGGMAKRGFNPLPCTQAIWTVACRTNLKLETLMVMTQEIMGRSLEEANETLTKTSEGGWAEL
jgi:hypothetical protein